MRGRYNGWNGKIVQKQFLIRHGMIVVGTASLVIKDQGIGISPEDLPHIFDRFYGVDSSRTCKTGGSGIGLSISKVIVEAHGGRIEARSQIGEGTEFMIELPLENGI